MRLIMTTIALLACMSTTAWSATTVTVQKNATLLANQLVTDPNIIISSPLAVTSANPAASQTGLLANAAFGTLPTLPVGTPVTMGANGIMLTTGNIGGTGGDLGRLPGDADVFNALSVAAPLTTGTFDASSLQFNFTVPAGSSSISLELIFASNETIGAAFPDAAVIMVDGVNFAKLGNGQLLSNQTAGILTATPAPQIVTGFAAASPVHQVIARLNPAIPAGQLHTIKIAIADNKDPLIDSAIIVANLKSTTSTQSGMGVKGTDFLPPVVTPPAPITVEATAPLSTVNLGAPTVTDNVDLGLRAFPTPAGPYPVGVTLITWTATDAAGNVGTATQTLSVQDTTPPVITPPAANTFSATSPTLNADITAYLNTVTATDAVGVVGPITNNAPPAGFPLGTTQVTFTASDAAGNIATATTNITVSPISIGASVNATALAQRLVQPPITFTGAQVLPAGLPLNQAGLVNSTNLGTLIAGPPAIKLLLPKQGIMLTTGSINGNGGNVRAPSPPAGGDADVFNALKNNASFQTTGTFDSSSLQFSFTVPAGTPSVSFDLIYATNETAAGVPFPDAAVVLVDGVNKAVFNNGLLLSNLNGAFLTPTNSTLVPGFANISQVMTLTALLNPALTMHTLKIAIADNTDSLVDSAIIVSNMRISASPQEGMGVGDIFPPVVTPPAPVTIEATAPLTPVALGSATVTDNVDPNLQATPLPLGPYPVGVTQVTWTATDAAGNVGTAIQTVTVTDTTPPALTVPANTTMTATVPSGLPASDVAVATLLASANATDAVGVSNLTNDAPTTFPVGTTTVTFTARDLSGLQTTKAMNLVVTPFIAGGVPPVPVGTDRIPPVIRLIGPAEDTVLQTAAPTPYADPGATVKDNFDGPVTPSIILGTPAIDTSVAGTTVLTYTATDAAGNTATIARIVHVVTPIAGKDLLPPAVTPPADMIVAATSFSGIAKTDASLIQFFASATALDNLVGATPVTNDAPAIIPPGKNTITFASVDPDGNRGTATATVFVSGVTPNLGSAIDSDGDLIPDDWEIAMFTAVTPIPPGRTTPTTAAILRMAGPTTDYDLDGLTDAQERILGTNPLKPNTNTSGANSDFKDAVYANSPSDSDGDGVIDALEDNASMLDASVVTGIPSVNGMNTFSINGNGHAIQAVAVGRLVSAPAAVNGQLGFLSYRVLTTVGATVTVRINSVAPLGSNGQFYKLDSAGNYSLIPASNVTGVGANTIDLVLTDGGPFDLDGTANGVIVDPIAFGSAPQVLGGSASAANGGGCSIQTNSNGDPLFPVLLFLSLIYLLHRKRTARDLR